MSKRKHTPEWMIARVEEYLSGKGSCKSIARAYGIGYKTLRNWIYKYRELGTCLRRSKKVTGPPVAGNWTAAGGKSNRQKREI